MLRKKVYKNYKELCSELGWEYKTGNSRVKQLKELKSLCKYHKDGNKIVIDKIFKSKNINNLKHKYEELDYLLLNYFNKFNKSIIFKTLNKLLIQLNLVNSNYEYGLVNRNKVSNYFQINIETVSDFYNSTQTKLKSIVNGSLDRLQKQGYIKYKYTYVLVKNKEYYIPDYEDNIEIENIEEYVLSELECYDKRDVFIKGKYKDFIDKVNEYIILELDVDKCYKGYYIYLTDKFKTLKINNKKFKKQLNDKIVNSCIESCNKRIENVFKNNIGIAKNAWDINRQRIDYLKESKIIINMFVNIKSNNIVDELKKCNNGL